MVVMGSGIRQDWALGIVVIVGGDGNISRKNESDSHDPRCQK